MSELADYQDRIRRALADPGDDLVGADVTRWSVRHWASASLRHVCPLTATLLVLRGEYDAEVTAHLRRGARPSSLHAWGRTFLERLEGHADRMVADVALLERVLTAPSGEPVSLPDLWVWDRDPWQVAMTLAAGLDPHTLPPADGPILVCRNDAGALVAMRG